MSIRVLTRPSIALFSLATLAAAAAANAQTPVPTEPLTLEQALRIAEQRSESIAAAQAGVRRAEADQDRARSGRRPQLSAFATYDRAVASEFSGVFDAGAGPTCAPFTLNPAAAIDARVAEIERAIDCGAIGSSFFGGTGGGGTGTDGEDESIDLPFGRLNTWRVSLSFTQSIFSGGRFGALDKIAAAGRQSAELTVNSTRAQLLFDVTQAYYDAALSDRFVAIAEASLGQADATVRQVRASFESGAQPEFELLRAQVARDNQRPIVIRQRANREIALLRLKQMLDLPADAPLQLATATTLTDQTVPPPAPFVEALANMKAIALQGGAITPALDMAIVLPGAERTAVKEVAAVVQLREASLAAARAERMPSASVNSSFSEVSYPSAFFPVGDFRTNWTIGASLQVPILTGGRLKAEERIAQAELDQSRAQLQQVHELAALDARSAWAELVAAQAAWEATSATIQQASRAYEIADVRYRAGVSTQLELDDARLLLQQSEANRAQAARDLQVARARLALLPDLPLSSGGASRPSQQPPIIPTAPAGPPQTPANPQLRNANGPAAAAGPIGGRQ